MAGGKMTENTHVPMPYAVTVGSENVVTVNDRKLIYDYVRSCRFKLCM
jgi:hypothetical protein